MFVNPHSGLSIKYLLCMMANSYDSDRLRVGGRLADWHYGGHLAWWLICMKSIMVERYNRQ